MHQTAPETFVQLCTPGWSRVPGEKMLNGTIPDSVLGKQRYTHDRESQEGWIQRNQLPTILHPAKQHTQGLLVGCLEEKR